MFCDQIGSMAMDRFIGFFSAILQGVVLKKKINLISPPEP